MTKLAWWLLARDREAIGIKRASQLLGPRGVGGRPPTREVILKWPSTKSQTNLRSGIWLSLAKIRWKLALESSIPTLTTDYSCTVRQIFFSETPTRWV